VKAELYTLLILTIREVTGNLMFWPIYVWREFLNSLDRMLGGPQSWFGCCGDEKKSLGALRI
jgi:hypothetical protein